MTVQKKKCKENIPDCFTFLPNEKTKYETVPWHETHKMFLIEWFWKFRLKSQFSLFGFVIFWSQISPFILCSDLHFISVDDLIYPHTYHQYYINCFGFHLVKKNITEHTGTRACCENRKQICLGATNQLFNRDNLAGVIGWIVFTWGVSNPSRV